MKKLLPSAGRFLVKNVKSAAAFLSLLSLLCISSNSYAQIYYLLNDGAAASNDKVMVAPYAGGTGTVVSTGQAVGPIEFAIDGNNNRLFLIDANQTAGQIKILNLTTGALIGTITSPRRMHQVKYDAATNYVYYSTEGTGTNPNAVLDADDAIYRVRPDGTGLQTVATSVCENIYKMILDIEHNQIIVYQSNYAKRQMITINISNLASPVITRRSFATSWIYVYDFTYDPNTGYIYYIVEGNGATVSNANDFLARQNLDGTGNVQLITSFLYYPGSMVGDWGNNRILVNEALAARAQIVSVDLATNTYANIPINLEASGGFALQTMAVPNPPSVTSANASSVSSTSATLGGNLLLGYGLSTERGVVYSSTNSTPTVADSKAVMATTTTNGAYSASVTGLNPVTTYYARAYAKNGAGTKYGSVITFATTSNDATLSAFTISSGTLTPAFAVATTTYTASVTNATTSITVTPTRNQANATIKVNNTAVTSGSASGTLSLNIGDNVITTIVTAQDGTTTKTYTLTITRPKEPQTITFASTASKTYGAADYAPGGSASSGLALTYTSSNTAVATIVSGQIHIVAAGTANITASQAGDANTLAAASIVQALTINKNAITVTATAGQTKVYGNTDPTYAYTITTGTLKSGDTFTGALSRAAGTDVGSYALTIGALALNTSNYTLTFVSDNFTISKRPLEITPIAQAKVYGDNDPASYSYQFTSGTSLANGDGMTGLFVRAAGETPGTYALSIGAKHPVNTTTSVDQSANYAISFVSNNLTITKRPLTIAPLPVTKVYGTADFASGAPYSFNGTTLAAGDSMTGTFSRDNTSENVGVYALTIGAKHPVNGGGVDLSAYYTITFVTNTFTITAKPITVTATAITKTYGDADPTLTYTTDASLAFSDAFTGILSRTAGESFGTYAINKNTLALSSNYTLTYTSANLTIGAKTINVTADAKNKTYGTADPNLTYTADALTSGDSFTGTLTRAAGEGVGTYAINQGSLALSNNYTINYTGNNLSIGKANLSYVATPATRTYQTTNPAFTGTVTGFISGDTQANSTTGNISFSTTATQSSALGNYPITGSGLSAANYDLVQAAGNNTALTITASADATLAGLSISPGTLGTFDPSVTSYGASVGKDVTSIQLTATVNQANATIDINASPLTSGVAKTLALSPGGNNFSVIVTAQDGSTKQYTLNIFRAYETNNLLSSIHLSGITFTPAFDPNTLNYTASVDNLTSSTDVYGIPQSNTAAVSVDGVPVSAASPKSHSLNVGETTVSIRSRAQDGTDKYYVVTVTRAASPDATLASIGNSQLVLNTPLVPGTLNYTATVANNVSSLYFIPVATNNRAIITVNGQPINIYSGNYMPIGFGDNTLSVNVVSEDGTANLTYTVAITRTRSANAALATIQPSNLAPLNEQFNATVYNYTATVTDSTYTGLPLKAYGEDEYSTVKINGTVVPRFADYNMAIHGGENTFTIVSTSQDGSATKTYTLVLTRAGMPPPAKSPVANLLALNISGNTTFSKNFNFAFDTLATVKTPNNVTSVRIFPVSANEVSTIKVNGAIVPYDTSTDLITIPVGDNLFTILVTSEDGLHTKTYNLHVNRLPAAVTTLASLKTNIGTLSPVFAATTASYTTAVPAGTASINVTPVATSATAVVTINGQTVSAANPTINVAIFNNIRIRTTVTAADGVNAQTYNLTVNITPEVPPTASSRSLVFSNITANSSTLSWTSGNGSARAVFIAKTANGVAAPFDNTTYSANITYAAGTQIGTTGWYCVYTGTGNTVNLAGLTPYSTYRVTVVDYNGTDGTQKYITTGLAPAGFATPASADVAPTSSSRLLTFANTTFAGTTVNWASGNGLKRAVFIAQTASGVAAPVNGVDYTASTTFRSGGQVGATGWYCIYNGTGSTADVNGLLPSTTYRLTVVEYNGTATATQYLLTGLAPASVNTLASPVSAPTTPSLKVVFANTTENATTVSWNSGNGTKRAVFIAQTANGVVNAIDNATYTANTAFGSGTQVGATGWYCIYNGTGNATSITGLLANTNYRVTVIEYNGAGGAEKYMNTMLNPAGVTTLPSPTAPPTTPSLKLTFNNTTETATTVSWNSGNGAKRAVFIAQTPNGVANAADNVTYTASAAFGAGTQVGATGWYCIYNGTGNTAAVSGLIANTTYRVTVIEYNGAGGTEKYMNTMLNPAGVVTLASPAAPPTVPSLKLTFSNIGSSSTTVSWNSGNGAMRAVFVAQTAYGVANGADNITYKPNTTFASGTQIGATGWYCVYNGTSNSTTISGLSTGTTYRVTVIEYNGSTGAEKYMNTMLNSASFITSNTIQVVNSSNRIAVDGNNVDQRVAGITVHPAVSPNGDGINDVLTIDGIQNYPANTLSVINRTGAQVFTIKGYDNSSKVFDGHTGNGTKLLPGTYFYSIDYQDGNETKHKTGYLVLKY